MKSKTSCFKACGAIARENMRRFWPIPVIGFLIYFLSGVFPILINYDKLKVLSDFIDLALKNQQPFFLAAQLFLPVTAAVLVFRYLHSGASVSVMHAMPFTRTCLFGGNFAAGFLLCISPVLLNGLILLCIAKPVYVKNYTYNEITGENVEEIVNVFSRHAVAGWLLTSCVIILFVFAVAVFAGIVTGNGLMHFLASLGFQFLVPMLYLTFIKYFSDYLFGFSYNGSPSEFFLKLSPYLCVFTNDEAFSAGLGATYTGIAVLIVLLSLLLYRKRELERAGDSLVFPFMRPIVCYIITFFSMSLFGLYFSMMDRSSLYRYAGYVAGALVGFLLAQMIVRKTVRIFDWKSARRFAVYCVVALLFFGGLILDVAGYAGRMPDLASVSSVTVNQNFLNEEYYAYDGKTDARDRDTFKEKENLILVSDFHHRLLEDRALFEHAADNLNCAQINLSYHLDNGSLFTRSYQVPVSLLRTYELLAQLYESAEYRKTPSIALLPAGDFNYLNISSNYMPADRGGYAYSTVTEKKSIHSLAQALSEDIAGRSFDDMKMHRLSLCTLEFGYVDRSTAAASPDMPTDPVHREDVPAAQVNASAEYRQTISENLGNTASFTVYPDYKNVLAWMREKGFGDYARPAGDFAAYMAVERHSPDGEDDMPFWEGMALRQTNDTQPPASTQSSMILTDREEINEILSLCESTVLDYDDYYVITLVLQTEEEPAFSFDTRIRTENFYLNGVDAPVKIKEYFQ